MAYQINIFDEIIVDNFAGGGGASTGIELALGRLVDIAINHDPAAIAMHKANHPFTEHYCESVWDVDPVKVCRGRNVALMWLSPDCKHFSKAKGGKPVEKHIRGLAWIAIRWAALVHPRVIILENVEEFKTWGRIDRKTGKPDTAHKGETFRSFVNALKHHGYAVEWRELRACDYGAPTSRKRLVLIARCDGKPIVFPKPTHGKGKGLKPYRTAAEIIDWTLPCPSIFTRQKPLVEATLRRIARGLDKFVINAEKPFIVPIGYGEREGQKPRVQDIDEPVSTVVSTVKQNVVEPYLTKFNDVSKGQAIDTPLDTIMAGATRFAKVDSVLTPFVEQANFDNTPISAAEPLSTATGVNKHRLVTPKLSPFIEQAFGGTYEGNGANADSPLPTVTATDHNRLVAASLIQYHSETNYKETRAYSLEEPIKVVDASNRYGLSAVYISKYYGGTYDGAGSGADEPLHTVTVEERHAVAGVFLSHFYKGNGSAQGSAADEPVPTVMGNNKASVVTAKLTPADLKCNEFGYWAEIREILNKYAGYALADDEILLIDINDNFYFLSDIGMRMLTPRELYLAQGFPSDYQIEFDYNGKPYSKKEQVARCGNAVCPPLAEAVVRANLPEYAVRGTITTMEELEKAMVA